MRPENDQFRWGMELVACFEDLRTSFSARSPAVVDCEIIPNFDGRPAEMVIWFICQRAIEVPLAEGQKDQLQTEVQKRMIARGFPKRAVQTLLSAVTSLEDIEAGGGRFYFFR